jgi:hypothetical protein
MAITIKIRVGADGFVCPLLFEEWHELRDNPDERLSGIFANLQRDDVATDDRIDALAKQESSLALEATTLENRHIAIEHCYVHVQMPQ